ncbi:PPE domain-containing protein [Saccharopolyspora griseoalba]|uniref:PPE domain-containing protein n=1 Tax=Saccharopolyspora griseoalba TaxID=1431848 RepID=A0ABW2LG10_9PSEU
MSDHRWQGYRHSELYAQIHDGPGPDSSTASVHRWSELTRALEEIDDGLAAAITAAASGWQGAAADSARSGLRPLGDWASLARNASEVMRERAEQQAEFIGRARREMPPPVQVTSEDPGTAVSALTHLFGGQTDFELQEAAQDAAEQRAFDVMRTYEASTRGNLTSLASFSAPPQVVVDAPGSPTSAGSGGSSQITVSWGAVAPSALRDSEARTAPAPREPADARERGRRGERDGAARSGRKRAENRGHSAGSEVTERLGQPGAFFDEPQTSSRPVIGGEPGR